MKRFAVIEVGSTNTKSCLFQGGEVIELPQKTINFKKNYKTNGKLSQGDFTELCEYIKDLKASIDDVRVYGTSAFREMQESERESFIADFSRITGIKFNIVSQEQESEYTVKGITLGNDYRGRLAIMIAGGGSTEVCIVENKNIIERHFNNYGAVDVLHAFPQINDLNPKMTLEDGDAFCDERTAQVQNQADILVIAGGDFLTFFEMAGDDFIEPNTIYEDKNQPHMVTSAACAKIDERFIFEQDIHSYQDRKPEYQEWWLGTRAMRFCVRAVAKKCGAKVIIPTKINMCLGIINELKGE